MPLPPTQPAEIHLRVRGHVQGIFYRATIRNWATLRGLSGYVKNEPDGSVEIVAQGPRVALEELQQRCYHAVSVARVGGIDVEWREPTEQFEDFSIL